MIHSIDRLIFPFSHIDQNSLKNQNDKRNKDDSRIKMKTNHFVVVHNEKTKEIPPHLS